MTSQTANPRAGSVFFVILLAIAMFAALSYAVLNGSRSSTSGMSEETAKIAAQEIIAYGDTVAKAVQALRLKGCAAEQLSFAGNKNTSVRKSGTTFNYTNGNSPTDNSCHVFRLEGGKVNPTKINSGYIDSSLIATASWMDSNSWRVIGARISRSWTDTSDAENTDIVMTIGRLTPEVCMKINDTLGITNPGGAPPVDSYSCDGQIYTGSFTACADAIGDIPELENKSAFCAGSSNNGLVYHFFRMLVSR